MDPAVTETYMGEWKNDKRTGFGVSQRSDGLKYEGEWYCNKKYGYGVTTLCSGEKEEGKYKNNVLITSKKKKSIFMMRSATFRERIDAAVSAAQRAYKIALQKADIAITRTATARGKAEQADLAAAHGRSDSDVAQEVANQYAPDFKQPGLEKLKALKDKFRYVDAIYKQQEQPMANDLTHHLPNNLHHQLPNKLPHNPPNLNQNYPNQLNQNQSYANQNQGYPSHLNQNQSYANQNQNQSFANQNQSYPSHLSHNQNPNQNQGYPNQTQGYPNQTQGYPNQTQGYPNQNQGYQSHLGQNQIQSQTYGNPTATAASNATKTVTISNELKTNELKPNEPNEKPMLRVGRNSIAGPGPGVGMSMSAGAEEPVGNVSALRRGSRRVSGDRPYLSTGSQQSSIDHFDHYKVFNTLTLMLP